MLVKSLAGLTLPGVYSFEENPQVIIQGIQTGTVAFLGTATKGSFYESNPYSSYDNNFINEYGTVLASGIKTDVKNYYSLALGMTQIASQGGAQAYPVRIGDMGTAEYASIAIPQKTSGNYTAQAKSMGTFYNGTTVKVENDPSNKNQVTELTVGSATLSNFTGDYFALYVGTTKHAFWMDETGTASAPTVAGATLHRVNISAAATANAIATAIATEVDAVTGLDAVANSAVVTITNTNIEIVDAPSTTDLVNLTIAVSIAGTNDYKKITITLPTGDSEQYSNVDNFLDDINENSQILDIISQSNASEFVPQNGTYTLASGNDGVTLGARVPIADFIGTIASDGTTRTGLELVKTLTNVRMIVMIEHYATFTTDGTTVNTSTGKIVDAASVKAIEVAEEIGAIVLLTVDPNLSYARKKELAQNPVFKNTDRVILIPSVMKFYEQYYKQSLTVGGAPFVAAMWAGRNPNESPSNKNIVNTQGVANPLSAAQAKEVSDISIGLCPIGEIPRGGIGCMNGQNTSSNSGQNQALRRRMADYILISVDRSLGDVVSELHNPGLRATAYTRIETFLTLAANDGLIGDSAGGAPYYLQVSDANNQRASILARRLNIELKVALFSVADFVIVRGSVGFDGVNLTSA